MSAYYNEIDPYAAQWLRNLIAAGHIADGFVDERSIADVRPDDLGGCSQCHFFAGIGGWSYALRLAGWPDDRPVWTGSCPCQPFSSAGKGQAANDERHLWPAWFSLIRECRPAILFGEQVEAAIGWGWLDAVFADLEAEGYACGATVLPACSVGAPHIRQRVWFVGNSQRERAWRDTGTGVEAQGRKELWPISDNTRPSSADGIVADALRSRTGYAPGQGMGTQATADQRDGDISGQRLRAGEQGATGLVADADPARCGAGRAGETGDDRTARIEPARLCADGFMGHAAASGLQGQSQRLLGTGHKGNWSDITWLPCSDGKARPTQSGLFPLAHGIPGRVGRLRAYGNAIVPQAAAEFVKAFISTQLGD
jgi:DNA (cytosine-5)-methyltransferase 1